MGYALSLGLIVALFAATNAHASGTAAGTLVRNTATASYTDPKGNLQSVSSNETRLRVDEVLNVAVASNASGTLSVTAGQTQVVTSFTVTNTGNGAQAYVITATPVAPSAGQFAPQNLRLYVDVDHDGQYTPGTDVAYDPAHPPVLAADGSEKLLLVGDIPAGAGNGAMGAVDLQVEPLVAQQAGGTNARGTVYAGKGDGGTDLIMDRGLQSLRPGYVVTQIKTTLDKSADPNDIHDPWGGHSVVRGATIVYTLRFTAAGNGSLGNVVIADAIPENTGYVAGSVTLDGVAVADATAYVATPAHIEVGLGTLVLDAAHASITHVVAFTVKVD